MLQIKKKGKALFKIFKSHFVLLSKMLGLIVVFGGVLFFYRMGDNFYIALATLAGISLVAVILVCLFLALNAVKLLKASGFASLDGIENGTISTNASKEIVASILADNSFEIIDGFYQRNVGFYKSGLISENFPSIRIALAESDGLGIKIKLVGASEKKLATNIQVFAFLAKDLTSRGYSAAFLY